jgi:hypothetical protein
VGGRTIVEQTTSTWQTPQPAKTTGYNRLLLELLPIQPGANLVPLIVSAAALGMPMEFYSIGRAELEIIAKNQPDLLDNIQANDLTLRQQYGIGQRGSAEPYLLGLSSQQQFLAQDLAQTQIQTKLSAEAKELLQNFLNLPGTTVTIPFNPSSLPENIVPPVVLQELQAAYAQSGASQPLAFYFNAAAYQQAKTAADQNWNAPGALLTLSNQPLLLGVNPEFSVAVDAMEQNLLERLGYAELSGGEIEEWLQEQLSPSEQKNEQNVKVKKLLNLFKMLGNIATAKLSLAAGKRLSLAQFLGLYSLGGNFQPRLRILLNRRAMEMASLVNRLKRVYGQPGAHELLTSEFVGRKPGEVEARRTGALPAIPQRIGQYRVEETDVKFTPSRPGLPFSRWLLVLGVTLVELAGYMAKIPGLVWQLGQDSGPEKLLSYISAVPGIILTGAQLLFFRDRLSARLSFEDKELFMVFVKARAQGGLPEGANLRARLWWSLFEEFENMLTTHPLLKWVYGRPLGKDSLLFELFILLLQNQHLAKMLWYLNPALALQNAIDRLGRSKMLPGLENISDFIAWQQSAGKDAEQIYKELGRLLESAQSLQRQLGSGPGISELPVALEELEKQILGIGRLLAQDKNLSTLEDLAAYAKQSGGQQVLANLPALVQAFSDLRATGSKIANNINEIQNLSANLASIESLLRHELFRQRIGRQLAELGKSRNHLESLINQQRLARILIQELGRFDVDETYRLAVLETLTALDPLRKAKAQILIRDAQGQFNPVRKNLASLPLFIVEDNPDLLFYLLRYTEATMRFYKSDGTAYPMPQLRLTHASSA